MQYVPDVQQTLNYLIRNEFFIYIQWLNTGYQDPGQTPDRLELLNQILSVPSLVSIRNGQINSAPQVQETREFIYGWARYRNLIFNC